MSYHFVPYSWWTKLEAAFLRALRLPSTQLIDQYDDTVKAVKGSLRSPLKKLQAVEPKLCQRSGAPSTVLPLLLM